MMSQLCEESRRRCAELMYDALKLVWLLRMTRLYVELLINSYMQ